MLCDNLIVSTVQPNERVILLFTAFIAINLRLFFLFFVVYYQYHKQRGGAYKGVGAYYAEYGISF